MLNQAIIAIAPFFVVLLDAVLVVFFVTMAARATKRELKWRLLAFAMVFVATFPIDLARLMDMGGAWRGTANVLWACLAAGGLASLVGWRVRVALAITLSGAIGVAGLRAARVPYDVIDSSANAFLALTGVVGLGDLHRRTRGFGSGVLTALWFLFLFHGSCFAFVARAGGPMLAYGFAIAVFLLWCQAVFGYVHLPRELKGQVPVRLPVAYPAAIVLFGSASILAFNLSASSVADDSRWPTVLTFVVVAAVFLPLVATYTRHRLVLVAHADEIEQRLAERTAETRRQHALLEEKTRELEAQKKLLEDKARELEVLASTDALTGLANRRTANDTLQRECARATRYPGPLSCILADVDHFKRVNDEHGHEVGDRVLKGIGAELRAAVRRTDLVCRFGGEEFLIICPALDAAGAEQLAERLRKRVSQRRLDSLDVTLSLGVATFAAGDDAESLIRRADGALYDAKGRGRNRVCVGERRRA